MSDLRPILAHLVAGQPLAEQQAFDAFSAIMQGQATDAQIGALLTAIATRPASPDAPAGGPTVPEITGAARAMRLHATPVPLPPGIDPVDTCGTGGDHAATFNVSTAAALIAAGAGAHVAKHGNRSVTSKSGSSQVLEALGVKLATSPDNLARCLTEARICFCFAPAHHPAMKHASGPRQQLGFRTLFNLLGPLTNPAGARRQLIGVYHDSLTEPFAHVLRNLGSTRAMIVHGSGLDEISTAGTTRITTLRDGAISTTTLDPATLGLRPATLDALRVASPQQSADLIRSVLAGDPSPARDIAALNAAAALLVADLAGDLAAALRLAEAALDSGAARRALATLVAVTQSP